MTIDHLSAPLPTVDSVGPDAEWVLVPRVPTRQMLRAAAKAMSPDRRPTTEWMSVSEKHAARYRAMIDAAPQRDPA